MWYSNTSIALAKWQPIKHTKDVFFVIFIIICIIANGIYEFKSFWNNIKTYGLFTAFVPTRGWCYVYLQGHTERNKQLGQLSSSNIYLLIIDGRCSVSRTYNFVRCIVILYKYIIYFNQVFVWGPHISQQFFEPIYNVGYRLQKHTFWSGEWDFFLK